MRRLLGLMLIVCAVITVLFSSTAWTQGPPSQVQVCHVVRNHELSNGVVIFFGVVLTIPAPAEPAHLNHGDVTLAQAAVDGSCCSFSVLTDGTIIPGRFD